MDLNSVVSSTQQARLVKHGEYSHCRKYDLRLAVSRVLMQAKALMQRALGPTMRHHLGITLQFHVLSLLRPRSLAAEATMCMASMLCLHAEALEASGMLRSLLRGLIMFADGSDWHAHHYLYCAPGWLSLLILHMHQTATISIRYASLTLYLRP